MSLVGHRRHFTFCFVTKTSYTVLELFLCVKLFWGPKIFLGGLNFPRGGPVIVPGGPGPRAPLWLRHCFSPVKCMPIVICVCEAGSDSINHLC